MEKLSSGGDFSRWRKIYELVFFSTNSLIIQKKSIISDLDFSHQKATTQSC